MDNFFEQIKTNYEVGQSVETYIVLNDNTLTNDFLYFDINNNPRTQVKKEFSDFSWIDLLELKSLIESVREKTIENKKSIILIFSNKEIKPYINVDINFKPKKVW